MPIEVGGQIVNPYTDVYMSEAEEIVQPAPCCDIPPVPANSPTQMDGCPSCPSIPTINAQHVVDYQQAMFAAKVAFVVGAATGLFLANFLRTNTNNGA